MSYSLWEYSPVVDLSGCSWTFGSSYQKHRLSVIRVRVHYTELWCRVVYSSIGHVNRFSSITLVTRRLGKSISSLSAEEKHHVKQILCYRNFILRMEDPISRLGECLWMCLASHKQPKRSSHFACVPGADLTIHCQVMAHFELLHKPLTLTAGQGPVACYCEHDNEHPGCIKAGLATLHAVTTLD
jgi:hypothetical protein